MADLSIAPAPDLATARGLRELVRMLRPLALTYDNARTAEGMALQHLQDAKQLDDGLPAESIPAQRSARVARGAALRARRALADGVARLLVRGHALDCPCRLCMLERRTFEAPAPDTAPARLRPPRKEARRG